LNFHSDPERSRTGRNLLLARSRKIVNAQQKARRPGGPSLYLSTIYLYSLHYTSCASSVISAAFSSREIGHPSFAFFASSSNASFSMPATFARVVK